MAAAAPGAGVAVAGATASFPVTSGAPVDDDVLKGVGELVEVRRVDPTTCGGGRGLFARDKISAGTVVARERAFLRVPTEREAGETLHAAMAREALQLLAEGGQAAELTRQRLAVLHPRELGELDAETIDKGYTMHSDALTRLCDGPGGAGLSRADALRLLLVCQFNGFTSGLYCRLAMINHRCDPNCAKFTPVDGAEGAADLSEIVAVRDIEGDEEITISYLTPFELSHGRRDEIFREQHLFPVGPSPFASDLDTPPNPRLEALLDELEGAPASAEERLKRALEVDAMCRAEAPCGFLVARVAKELSRAILQIMPSGAIDASLVVQLVRSIQALLGLQRRYLPPHHHELGTTLIDYHNALEHAIANHADALYAAFPAELGSFRLASRADFKAKKEGRKIQKVYT